MPTPTTIARTRWDRIVELYEQVAEFYERADLDRWDTTCVVGLLMALVGLWVCLGFGVALSVVGGLVLVLGVVGARQGDDVDTDTGG